MIGNQDIIYNYELLYREKYGNEKYIFKPTPRAEQEISNFLLFFDKRYKLITLGKDFLFRYFNFQFRRVDGLILKRFSSKDKSGKIQIYDIIGKKAIEYWLTRDVNFDFITEIDAVISKQTIIGEETVSSTNKHEELEKKRFHNTNRGFLNCVEKTSLFNHKSTNCVLCIFKNTCKSVLEKNYMKIYKNRGYVTAA